MTPSVKKELLKRVCGTGHRPARSSLMFTLFGSKICLLSPNVQIAIHGFTHFTSQKINFFSFSFLFFFYFLHPPPPPPIFFPPPLLFFNLNIEHFPLTWILKNKYPWVTTRPDKHGRVFLVPWRKLLFQCTLLYTCHWTRHFLQGTRNTPQCLTGHPVVR